MKFTKALKFIVAALMLTSVTAAFFGVPYTDFACKLQPSTSYWFVGIVVLSFAWGRFFCEAMCPLGILQSIVNKLFHPKTQVRRVCSRLPETKTQLVVRYGVLAALVVLVALGCGGMAWSITPYAIYGKALALFVPGLVIFAAVLVSAAIGKGRFWCNWICPFGTLFSLIARVAYRKQQIAPCCKNCRACFPTAGSTGTSTPTDEPPEGVTRRETLKGIAMFAAVEAADKLTDGGYAPISLHEDPKRVKSVLPPGAGKRSEFELRCVGCELCVKNCPGECLKPSTNWKNFGQPEMNFALGHCITGCTKCGEVCPARALEKLDEETKINTHMGFAVWHQERCLRKTEGVPCTACMKKCPVGAIHDVEGVLVVDKDKCIGCGACEHVCAARPIPAMTIEGLDEQRVVRPIGERDLIAEMLALIHGGKAVVLAKDGVITRQVEGSGVKPILDLLAEGALEGALVVDKIIGRAAAAACVVGKARKVVASVMSEGAKAFLNAHGIPAEAETLVLVIINRKGDGQCPMELRVKDLTDPGEMVKALG